MLRRFALLFTLALLLGLAGSAGAHPTDGCYATATPTTVNEGQSFTVTVQCDNVPTENNVFGFQIGTTRSGDFVAGTVPAAYTAGTFSEASTGADSGVVVGTNALSGYYAVTRRAAETVNSANFSLGSYALTAEDNLTSDSSVDITMTDADFILSDINGTSLTGWLRDVNDVSVTITNLDLAWLSGDMIVRSDVTAISNVGLVDLTLGGKLYSATDVASYTNTFNMDSAYLYAEDGSPASDGTLSINATADMTGHLACATNSINLGDTGSATDVDTKIGTTGTITLKAGDADDDDDIDNADATLIGANIGTNPGDDRDVNGDNSINVLDLVHVGRNFDTLAPTSCGTGS
ncbi:MAG: hypothetical protein IT320_26920 [Anaerolineae bacterium]|nr:hypothetical protein [Anaerolineae bacterium]